MYTLLGGADTVFFPLLSHKGHDYFNGTTLRDYRIALKKMHIYVKSALKRCISCGITCIYHLFLVPLQPEMKNVATTEHFLLYF